MQFESGIRLGPYVIVSPIGEGGMGEVYEARDTRLDRRVAVKVLPPGLGDSPQLRERFDREARLISQLNHPNICTLYDVGRHDGSAYLVMELIDGENLADRIARGPLPLRDVIRYGVDIAAALECAHRSGIVHRDLKPGNVMLTRSGAKVLDFGLAKYTEAPSPVTGATMQKPLTGAGTVVGTLQSMAPEQLDGREADARTDIFAFGLILYEMATGRRAFVGASRTSLIAAILEQDPQPMSSLQPMTPMALERIVRVCLEKDPEQRWQTAHDVRLQLQAISSSGETVSVAPQRSRPARRELIAWIIALTGIAAASWLGWRAANVEPAPPMRFSILPTAGERLPDQIGLAVSPDGSAIAYTAPTADADRVVWLRRIDTAETKALAGTEDAHYPFWSPDGESIGFFAHGRLKKVSIQSGTVERIADAPYGRGGTWNERGQIVYAPDLRGALFMVNAAGGTPIEVTPASKTPSGSSGTRRWPKFVPDGKRFLFFGGGGGIGGAGVYAGSIDGIEPQRIALTASQAEFVDGFLLFVRDGVLIAQRFDLDGLQLRGTGVALAEAVEFSTGFNRAEFSVARNGMIVFKERDVLPSQLTWFDRRGAVLGTVGQRGMIQSMRLSPSEDRVALIRIDPVTQNGDVWIEHPDGRAPQRVSFRERQTRAVVWSPDERDVLYGQSQSGPPDVLRKSIVDASEPVTFLAAPGLEVPNDWSPDGKTVIVQQVREGTRWDLMVKNSDNGSAATPWIATSFDETSARFSPDGKWVAYATDETGRSEIYVRPFPGPGTATRVSVDGGVMPVWRGDGREIFFLTSRSDLMAAAKMAGDVPRFTTPVKLFTVSTPDLSTDAQAFDVTRDGRFLINARTDRDPPKPMHVLLNWMDRVPRE